MNKEIEPILNWMNNLNGNKKEQGIRIANKIQCKLNEGFTMNEVINLLVGEGEPYDSVISIASTYIEEKDNNIKNNTPVKKIPSSYDDVKHIVEAMVEDNSLFDFFSENPMLNNNRLKYLTKYANMKVNNQQEMAQIHSLFKDYVTELISDTENLVSEAKANQSFGFKKISKNKYLVKDQEAVYEVDIDKNICNCARYLLGGMKPFGLSCEHIIEAKRFHS